MRWSVKKLLGKLRMERLKKAKEQIELLQALEYQERLTEQQENRFWADFED